MKTKTKLTKDEAFAIYAKRIKIFSIVLICAGLIQTLTSVISYSIDRFNGLDYEINYFSSLSILSVAFVILILFEIVKLEYRVYKLEEKEKEPDKSDS